MQNILIVAGFACTAFLVGYGLRRVTSKWEDKASSARAAADLQAEQLEATVSASLDGIIIINSEGHILEFSESAERIFGCKRSDVVGKEMSKIIVPERYRAAHNKGMARMRETGKANILGQRIEIEALRADGEEFISELAISRSRGSNGDIFIAYIRDISEAKAAEKALRDAKEAAELANRAKTQFISSMSHEIRTPFNAVLGILDILGDTKLTRDQKQLVQTADRSSRALLRIINDVLDYARISSGSVKIVKEPFHAPDIFDDVYRLFAMQAKDRNINLTLDHSKAKRIYLAGDAGRIRQILMNFVSNAIKYTKDGKIDLIVETESNENGGVNLTCTVKDNGLGIDDDKQDHLFTEFYMAEDVDVRASEGTGLGLTICKVLTRMMGGTIGVQSQLGEGSEFWIELPLQESMPAEAPEDMPAARADISDLKILLVEDNPTNRMVVRRVLEKQGVNITTATNGIEALSSLELQAFDLLLTDVFMPEMGGKELVERLRSGGGINTKLPVIALTAMGDIHEAEELKSYGVDQVILKPFNSKDLIQAITEQCSKNEDGNAGNLDTDEIEIVMSGGLMDGLDADDLIAIKGQFEADLKEITNTLREAIERQDIEAAQFSSHSLKGLAGVYGLKLLSDAAELTNSNCKAGKLNQMVEHGMRAIKIADVTMLKLDDLFQVNEEAA